jgi:CheY-like chemotaxis protein
MSPDELIALLPYARRYARALTGAQVAGDAAVARVIANRAHPPRSRLGLYAGITRLVGVAPGDDPRALLRPIERQQLLLTALEGLSLEDAASVVGIGTLEARVRLDSARLVLLSAAAADVLIIEDEPIIAMDIRRLLQECGHRVVGVAASEAAALALAVDRVVGLVVADIDLGEGGNGIAAVRNILQVVRVPVIFVTAYPQQLLTANGVEPAFVMNKPFDPVGLAVSAYQAVTAGRVPLH